MQAKAMAPPEPGTNAHGKTSGGGHAAHLSLVAKATNMERRRRRPRSYATTPAPALAPLAPRVAA
jgi:hypothetical protein